MKVHAPIITYALAVVNANVINFCITIVIMNTLARRLAWARTQKDLTQTQLAKLADVAQSTIGSAESGARETPRKIVSIATALGVDPLWLAEGKGEPFKDRDAGPVKDEHGFIVSSEGDAQGQQIKVGGGIASTPVRVVKLKVQAGSDGFVAEPDYDTDGGLFEVPTEVIEKLRLDPSNLIMTTFRGRSMEPMYFDGERGLIDLSKKEPVPDECFVVNWNGETLVKKLIKKTDGWALYSFNKDFPTINVRSGYCSIIGMVVWQPARIVKGLL